MDRNVKIVYTLTNDVFKNFSNKLIFVVTSILYGGLENKKSQVFKKRSSNGEIHFILPELSFDEIRKNARFQ